MSTECKTIIENNNNNGEKIENRSKNSEFPKGMRVLAVDDNKVCLHVLTALLIKCQYQVTSLMNKTEALELLQQQVDDFDIVLTNVNIDEMDGFKLLEAGLELDIPVIMISACESEPIIMKGVRYGAVDYLIKPVRFEAVKTIWQHVYRKNLTSPTPSPPSPPVNGSLKDDIFQDGFIKTDEEPEEVPEEVRDQLGTEDDNNNSLKRSGKQKCILEEDDDDLSKKDRIKWTQSLHGKFLDAIQMLGGVEKAVPKKILELMKDPSLTREKVASHLQKYRKYLKNKNNVDDGGEASTSTAITTTNNNNNNNYVSYDNCHRLSASSSNPSSGTLLSNQLLLGNMLRARTSYPSLNYPYQTNYNPWLTGPSVDYTPPPQQQQQQQRVDQVMYPQQSGNFMNTVSNTLLEPPYPQLPLGNFGDLRPQQVPEEITDPNHSMFDSMYETSPLNNILDIATDYPGLLDYSEDCKTDQYYRTS